MKTLFFEEKTLDSKVECLDQLKDYKLNLETKEFEMHLLLKLDLQELVSELQSMV